MDQPWATIAAENTSMLAPDNQFAMTDRFGGSARLPTGLTTSIAYLDTANIAMRMGEKKQIPIDTEKIFSVEPQDLLFEDLDSRSRFNVDSHMFQTELESRRHAPLFSSFNLIDGLKEISGNKDLSKQLRFAGVALHRAHLGDKQVGAQNTFVYSTTGCMTVKSNTNEYINRGDWLVWKVPNEEDWKNRFNVHPNMPMPLKAEVVPMTWDYFKLNVVDFLERTKKDKEEFDVDSEYVSAQKRALQLAYLKGYIMGKHDIKPIASGDIMLTEVVQQELLTEAQKIGLIPGAEDVELEKQVDKILFQQAVRLEEKTDSFFGAAGEKTKYAKSWNKLEENWLDELCQADYRHFSEKLAKTIGMAETPASEPGQLYDVNFHVGPKIIF